MSVQHINNVCLLSTQPPDSFQKGQVSFPRSVLFKALSSAYPDSPIGSDASHKRIDQSGLPDAGFSSNKNDLTFPFVHLMKPASHSCQCFIATNKSPGRIFSGQMCRRDSSNTPDFLVRRHLFAFFVPYAAAT